MGTGFSLEELVYVGRVSGVAYRSVQAVYIVSGAVRFSAEQLRRENCEARERYRQQWGVDPP
jgi:hypothetical protein